MQEFQSRLIRAITAQLYHVVDPGLLYMID